MFFHCFICQDKTIMAATGQFEPKENAFAKAWQTQRQALRGPLKVDRSAIQRLISLKILAILRNLFSSLFAGRFAR